MFFAVANDLDSSEYDALVVVASSTENVPFRNVIDKAAQLDPSLLNSVSLYFADEAPGHKVFFAQHGKCLKDTDDSRVFYDLGKKAIARVLASKSSKPLFWFGPQPQDRKNGLNKDFKHYIEAFLFGVLQEIYIPLQAREHFTKLGQQLPSVSKIGVHADKADLETVLKFVSAVEKGKIIARDMGGSDPERMTPLNCAAYITDAFKGSKVKVTVESSLETLKREYPLLHAVARCSFAVVRHWPCVVKLEYRSPDQSKVKENLFLVGKGVTFDTGGADLKAGGIMRGMSRDKCGATACAGFLKTLELLKPLNVNCVAYLGFVRNSVGSDSFVCDEIIQSRAGTRVLIGNTDAEGRLVMCDLLCKAKEDALLIKEGHLDGKAPARLFTVATLTGHAIRANGPYTCILDNGPAREAQISSRVSSSGHLVADPMEISSLRREDYQFIAAGSLNEDIVQANDKASSATSRGHQFPMAFMATASGLVNHALDSQFPICYTHMDIAGSAEESPVGLSLAKTTGAPIAALASAFTATN